MRRCQRTRGGSPLRRSPSLTAPASAILCFCLGLLSLPPSRADTAGSHAFHLGPTRGAPQSSHQAFGTGTGTGYGGSTRTSPVMAALEALRRLLVNAPAGAPGQGPAKGSAGRLRRTGSVPEMRRLEQQLEWSKGRGRWAGEKEGTGGAKGLAGRSLHKATRGVDSWHKDRDSWSQLEGVKERTAGGRWGPRLRRQGRRQLKRVKGPARLWGDASVHPRPPTPSFQTPLKTLARKGQCRAVAGKPVVIKVSAYSDIVTRTRYPPWRTVTLEFQRGFPLPQGLLLAANFSCTILRNKPGVKVVLSTSWANEPGITFYGTSNILMTGIGFTFGITGSTLPCKSSIFFIGRESPTLTCPGIYIVRSFGVQVTKASIFGRIDVFRSIFVRLDSLSVTMPADSYDKAQHYRDFDTYGVIRMGETSLGPTIVASNNVISNCEVFGFWELITIYRGAVGVTVRNNYLHDFLFAGIRCGARVSEVMDCHHNIIGYNYIWNPPSYPDNPITDENNAGIYTCLHWYDPANYITCNYIENQRFCHYLDFASSGVTIDGGVCLRSWVAVKVNNGKFNKVRSVVFVEPRQFMTYISCVTVTILTFPGNKDVRNWEAMRRAFYDTPTINRAYPYMKTICNPVPSAYNGHNCNPSGGLSAAQTGQCSGLAYGNDVETFAFNTTPATTKFGFKYSLVPYLGCEKVPAMPLINRHVWYNVSKAAYAAKFINPQKLDFGVRAGSPIYKIRKSFKSCPRARVGIKVVQSQVYYKDFNIGRPKFFDAMLQFPYSMIANRTKDVSF